MQVPGPSEDWLDLTCSQDQIYLGEKHFGRSAEYNVAFGFLFTGAIDLDRFREAFRRLVAEAENLRLRFKVTGGRAVQTILPHGDIELQVIDFSTRPDPQAAFLAWGQSIANQPIDVDEPVRGAWLAVLGPERAMWLLDCHHAVSDGWGMLVLYRRFKEIYEELASGETGRTRPLPSFLDLVAADQAYRSSQTYRDDQAFWREKLKTLPGPVLLYGKTCNGTINAAHRVEMDLNPEAARRLAEMASSQDFSGRTLNVAALNLMLAAYSAFLYHISGQTDFNIGVPFSNRHGTFRRTPGILLGTVPIAVSIREGETFRSLIQSMREESALSAAHSRYPVTNPGGQVFNVLLNMHNRLVEGDEPVEAWFFPGVEANGLVLNVINPDFEHGRVTLAFDLSDTVFDAREDQRLLAHFRRILAAMLADPDCRLDAVSVLDEDERRQVLVEFNPPPRPPSARNFPGWFAEQAAHSPDHTAVESAEGDRLTYRELDDLSARLAAALRERGARPGTAVGLHLDRSARMMVAMLAIFKSGAAYVPLDPTYPPDRLAYMAADAGVGWILTQRERMFGAPPGDARILFLDEEWEDILARDPARDLPAPDGDDLAYITYTSGSTGRPKGVEVTQAGLASYLEAITGALDLCPDDRFLYFAALGFDATFEEILPAWLSGAAVVLRPGGLPSLSEFNQLIDGRGITALSLPAAFWGEWVLALKETGGALPPGLRLVLTYAEEPSLPRYLDWRQIEGSDRARWINTYGPTEIVVTASLFEPSPDDGDPAAWKRMPVGSPLPNHPVYILNSGGGPVLAGVPGEIYIGGEIARGYRNLPEETQAAFRHDPFAGRPGARMYRTGDRGRHLPDGTIEFLGRVDAQMKLHGFRIEPGEIENHLARQPGVRQAAVALKEATGGTKRLVAYLALQDGQEFQAEPARAALRRLLPEYMIPSDFVTLPELPLTPNGKIDRRALPDPVAPIVVTGEQTIERHSAQTALEAQLIPIWEDLLGVAPIDIDQDFFELGGNSLLGVRMFAQLEHRLGLLIPTSALLEAPTIRQLAANIEARPSGYRPSTVVMIQPGGPGLPFFLVHGWGGGVVGYADLARSIGSRWPVFGLQAAGLAREEAPDATLEAMVTRYIRAIRSVQPQGPYRIGGYCTGGLIAYAMACRLAAEGETVGLVAVIEGTPPGVEVEIPGLLDPRRLRVALDSIPFWLRDYRELGLAGIRQRILRKIRMTKRFRETAPSQPVQWRINDIILDNPGPLPDMQKEILWIQLQFMSRYQPESYPGQVAVFSARYPTISTALSGPIDLTMGWDQLARGGISLHVVDSSHRNIHLPPYCYELAKGIREELEKADRGQ